MNHPELSRADYGLLGHPLGHSFSRIFFRELFASRGQDLLYENFDLPALDPAALYGLILMHPRLRGFNVTSPYKEVIMEYLDKVSDTASRVGAVNTVRLVRDASGRVVRLEGFNTDVEGFRESIRPLVARFPEGTAAMVLGTGGASKAAVEGLRQLGLKAVRVSRTPHGKDTVGYADLTAEFMATHPVVVNATPLGTYPDVDKCVPLPFDLLPAGAVCFDMVYNPSETLFMRRCASAGAVVKNGQEMLERQAVASLGIWENTVNE